MTEKSRLDRAAAAMVKRMMTRSKVRVLLALSPLRNTSWAVAAMVIWVGRKEEKIIEEMDQKNEGPNTEIQNSVAAESVPN